jgi:hypothetical protein
LLSSRLKAGKSGLQHRLISTSRMTTTQAGALLEELDTIEAEVLQLAALVKVLP